MGELVDEAEMDLEGEPCRSSGVDMIAAERQRQVERKGWTPKHDERHDDGSLVDAAVVYASPRALYVKGDGSARPGALGVTFMGLWPHGWEYNVDAGRTDGQALAVDPVKQINAEKPARRIRELTKAGALIAAEIDRIQRQEARIQRQEARGGLRA